MKSAPRLHPDKARRIGSALTATSLAEAFRQAAIAMENTKKRAKKTSMAVEAGSDRPAKGIAGDSHDG